MQIFISYARNDGADESLRLYNELQAHGIDVWRDNRIDPSNDFTGEIEAGINKASHVVVLVTPDLRRADSFVRLEIGYALTQKKPIIPLAFPGGHRPITIINHTYINFTNWEAGFALLLERLKSNYVEEIDPQTRREREIAYLQKVGQQYDHWRDLYTDMSAIVHIEEQKVNLKPSARRMIEMRHRIYEQIDYTLTAEQVKTVKTETLDELREGIRNYRRVALIGDPGGGKTTTLERLAYEYASIAADESNMTTTHPLPLFVRLGDYTGEDFTEFLEAFFGGLHLRDYLPERIVLLLDGLNEMPSGYRIQLDTWLRDHSDVAVIVSCRRLDYMELKLPLQRVDIAPLDLERIRLFISNYLEDKDRETLFWALAGYSAQHLWNWYRTVNSAATYRNFFSGNDKLGLWEPEYKGLSFLRQQFQEQNKLPDMLDVVTNPFLMQIVIEIYALSGEPPRNKGNLFERFVDLMMKERGKSAVCLGHAWVDEKLQKRALAVLAYRIQSEHKGTSVGVEFVRETFRQAVSGVDPDSIIYFAVSASILEQTDTIRFSHQLLQEYFAAYEMGEDIRRGILASKYFPSADWWKTSGWEETALLLAGMDGDATRVVMWLTAIQPNLAYRVATESGTNCDKKALQALYEPPEGTRRSPFAVAAWGRLNHEHETRAGVGLRRDGLPDIVWCDVPADTFLYGSDKAEVTITQSFKIAKYVITYQQFQRFIVSDDYKDERWWAGMPDEYHRQPVIQQNNPFNNHPRDRVTWYQAVAFTRWLDQQYREAGLLETNTGIRLPTEQEWEFAARGTDGREYPWGDGYRVGYANVDEQEQSVGPYFLNRTTAVGSYPQGMSPYGVLDMSGNIWEWCINDFDNPEIVDGYGSNEAKVLRGGPYGLYWAYSRTTFRNDNYPDRWNDRSGFRIVMASLGVLD